MTSYSPSRSKYTCRARSSSTRSWDEYLELLPIGFEMESGLSRGLKVQVEFDLVIMLARTGEPWTWDKFTGSTEDTEQL
jgi:hypothetical protein